MANRITVSALGPLPPLLEKDAGMDSAVQKMMDHWKRELDQVLPDRPDLIVLPETCDRYSDHSPAQCMTYYRHRGEGMRDFFAGIARENRCSIAYSSVRELPDGSWRNSTQVIDRTGTVAGIYDKNHVTIEENVEYGIRYGVGSPVIVCDFGRVSCAICFDLNFDQILELTRRNHPDLIVFSSMYHGGLMQRYWAYRCRSHFVGAIAPPCPCAIINPVGEVVAQSTNYFPRVTARINLDCCVAHLDYNEERLSALKKRYGPGVTVSDPGFLGSVLVTSETEGVSACDMARQFEIELLDDYFARALEHRRKKAQP
jgi:predicted amidohydrolase